MNDTLNDEKLRRVRCFAMDVDGVLTEGGIAWGVDSQGELFEWKQFHVRDGLGLSVAREAGLEIVWITGRSSPIVARRAAELRVAEVCQWARDKRLALEAVRARRGLAREEVLFLGDDLNDLPAFEAAGIAVAVADAAPEVRARADWITEAPGGRGAVREVAERILKAQGRWEAAVAAFLARLAREAATGEPAPPLQ